MTTMKKNLSLLLAALLAAASLAACTGSQAGSTADPNAPAGNSAAGTDSGTQEPYTVKLMLPGEAKTEECALISEEASKLLQEKFNTSLEITRVGFGTYPQEINLMFSSGEKLDLLYNNRDIFVSAINNGQIVCLDEYLPEYGPNLLAQIPPERLATTSVDGKVYAIPANKEIAVSWGFAFNKDMADATGVDYTNIKTEEELVPLLEAVKEKFPNVWPIVPNNGDMTMLTHEDDLGGDFGSLEDCTDSTNTTVVNFAATETYKTGVERRYAWQQKGYIPPDAVAITEQASSQLQAEKGFGWLTNSKPGIEGEMKKSTTKNIHMTTITDVFTSTTRFDILWYVAHNSEKPERAVQVLDEIYSNPDLINICINGVEGRHYEFKDKEKGIIGFPDGVDGSNVGYPSYPWAWPNEMISYVWDTDPEDIWTATSAWNDTAIQSPALGFTWDNSKVLNEVTACKNAKDKFNKALVSGSVDPAEALPAYLSELESAGVNTIIAEKQAQLDAWLAQK